MSRFSMDVNYINAIIFIILAIACLVGVFVASWQWIIPTIMAVLIASVSIVDIINENK